MEFGDLRSAARMRDLIERIAGKVVDKKRPDVRIGYVNNYDSGRQLAWVKFPGDDELVKVRIALNMLPTRTIQSNGQDEADIVRVAGKPGSYYVIDFVRGVPQNPDNIPIVDVNFNQQKGINAGDATSPQDVLNLRTADARFATTAAVNSKEPALPTGGNTGHYLRGDKTWQTLNKAAVGLDQVDNVSDANKPLSTAAVNALALKAPLDSPAFTGTPTGITKAHVGLGNVDNTSDAAKPVSTATQTALNSKADLVGGVIPDAQLPPLAILDTFVVASQAAMLALTAQKGNVAVRTDINQTFRLTASPASTLANWQVMPAAGAVTSVAGKTGTVALVKADVGLSNVDNTSDAAKPVSTATQTALNLKADDTAVVKLTVDQAITGKKTFSAPVAFDQLGATPTPPPAGDNQIYFKSDGLPYFMGADGTERPFRDVAIALHANPGFESWSGGKPTEWDAYWRDSATYPAPWSQDTVDKIGGGSSMRIGPYLQQNGANGRVQTTVFPALPGQIVQFDIWAKADSPLNGASLDIGLLTKKDGDPNFFDPAVIMQAQTFVLSTTWRKYSISWRVPSDHNNCRIDVNPFTYTTNATIGVRIDESFTSVLSTGGATGVETGSINLWPFATPPAGYLMCDGSIKNIVDYPVLAALCGTAFGGDGTTTFGLPDLRGRLPLGASTLNALRSNEGVAEASRNMSHTHTIAHSHTINHDHADTFSLSKTAEAKPTGSGGGQVLMSSTSLAGGVTAYSGSSGGSSAASSGNQPNTGTNSIPFLAVNFIIKT